MMNKKVIHSVFEQVVLRFPSGIAIEANQESITYTDLNIYANRLSHLLQSIGTASGKIVNVMVPPSVQTVSALLAVFKSGGIYLPFDLSFSEKRLKQIFNETFDGIIIAEESDVAGLIALTNRLNVKIEHLIVIKTDRNFIHFNSLLNPVTIVETDKWSMNLPLQVDGDSSNYIFYTSGSTGDGKAIVGSHAGLSHFIHWEIGEFSTDEKFRFSQLAQTTFDAFLRDVFVALISGGTLCIPAADVKSNPARLLDWLSVSKINMVHCVPSLFRVLTRELLSDPGHSYDLSNLKYILMGGELLFAKDIISWRKAAGESSELVNIYGATETTLIKTFYRIKQVSDNPSHVIPVGIPISNTTVAIIKDGRICRIGESGEIYIKTPFTTKGYYKNEVLTSLSFVQNPLVEGEKDIVYKTGDLGRYLPDGNIEVLGRLDNQVKINGVRVELAEVEGAMLENDNITGSVVNVYRSDDNLVSLVGYYTGEKQNDQELRHSLASVLNPQIIPSYFIHLNEFPLNINGKIDKRALPLSIDVIMRGADFQAPVGELEIALAEVWKELLGLERIGRNISFFSIGGHSLRAIQLTSRIEKAMNVSVKVADIFMYSTLQELAAFIGKSLTVQHRHIPSVGIQPSYALSSSQRRIWILSQFKESNIAYNISGAYIFKGDVDVMRFNNALKMLVERHESLRTVFREDEEGIIRQYILLPEESYISLRQKTDAHIEKMVAALSTEPFDLAAGPLLRAGLWQEEDQTWVFAYTMHHIISDYWSMSILVKELLFLYNKQGLEQLPALRIQYRDYAAWQQEELSSGAFNDHKVYWLNKLQGDLPVLMLPTDKERPLFKTFNGSIVSRTINKGTVGGLITIGQERGATLFMMLLASVTALLHRYTSQEDIVIGSPVAGRTHIDLEDQIGLYLNTLALRMQFRGSDSFFELLDNIIQITKEAYDHQVYPLDDLLDNLHLQRDMSRNSLFDVFIDLHDDGYRKKEQQLGNLVVDWYRNMTHVVSKFDLTFMFMESAGGLYLTLEYNTDLFAGETIERLCDHFEQLLESIILSPAQPVRELSCLSTEEKHNLLTTFNQPASAHYNYRSVMSMLEKQHPYSIALQYKDHPLSYAALDEQSTRLAGYLVNNYGELTDKRIGILLDRSFHMIIAVLGIWKAGAAYVPVDPEYPLLRKKYMLQDAGIEILLTNTDYIFGLDGYTGAVVALDIQLDVMEIAEGFSPKTPQADNIAYVIYTSGSTGTPKGCVITHGNLSNYIQWANQYYFKDAPCFGLFTSLSFDLTVTSIFCTLSQGGILNIYNQEDGLAEILADNFGSNSGVDSIKLTPAHISLLKEADLSSSTMRCAIIGGEQVTPAHVSILKRINPDIEIYNEYGPTETTVGCIATRLEENEPVLIGKPIANTWIYILTENSELCPTGVHGEICIGGYSVGRGYLNLQTDKFIADPFNTGGLMYRTGDLGKWQSDGNLVFMGRLDEQVKIRGYRIEPGEVDKVLQQHTDVDASVVTVKVREQGEKELVAYVVMKADLDIRDLRSWLALYLPSYMIPAHFILLPALPLTTHGKIDKKALPDPDSWGTSSLYTAARTAEEQALIHVYEDVLKKTGIGISDDFFIQGGDSIKAIQVVSRLKQQGFSVTVQDVLMYPLIEALGSRVKRSGIREADQGLVFGKIPLSPVQHWFFSNGGTEKHYYNQSVLLQAADRLSAEGLRFSLDQLILHHDALRMVYRQTDSGWEQENRGVDQSYGWQEHTTAESDFEAVCTAIQSGLDLSTGPLLQACLFRFAEGDRLLLVAHHLVTDGVTWRILLEDLSTLYSQYLAGSAAQLPLKTDSFLYWQQQQLLYANDIKEKDYWSSVADREIAALPVDYEGGSNTVSDMVYDSFVLDEGNTALLLNQCYKSYRTEINDILLTALLLAVGEEFGIKELALTLEGHGREDIGGGTDVTRTAGWFTSIYPVVLELEDNISETGQLIRVKEQLHRIPNKGIGYGILRYLGGEQYRLVPSVNFNYLGEFNTTTAGSYWELSGIAHGRPVSGSWVRETALDVTGIVTKGQLRISVSYSRQQYDASTIARLTSYYQSSLESLISTLSDQQETQLTPVDLSYKGLSLPALEAMGNVEDVYRLSPLQEGLYYQWLMSPHSSAYFEQMSYRLEGDLDIGLLAQSYDLLVSRHRVLRTHFIQNEDMLLQVVQNNISLGFSYTENEDVSAFRVADRSKGFDLHNGSQMRLTVVGVGVNEYEFIWSHHHILMDGWCSSILIKEYFKIYDSLQKGIVPSLAPVYPYVNYIDWLSQQDAASGLEYWRNYLSGYDIVSTLPKKENITTRLFDEGHTGFTLDADIRASVKKICGELGVTENTFIQVAWGLLLSQYTHQPDVLFGAVVSGRPPELKGVEEMIGLFINTIPVRIQLNNETVKELLKKAQQTSIESVPHHYTRLGHIQAQSPMGKELFDHIILFENYPVQQLIEESVTSKTSALHLKSVKVYGQNNFDFTVTVFPTEKISVQFDYNRNVYEDEQVEHFKNHFIQIINKISRDVSIKVNEISYLTDEEQQELLSFGEGLPVKEASNLLSLIADKTILHPDKPALRYNGKTFTYSEIQDQSDRLAGYLVTRYNTLPDQLIGVLLDRSPFMIIGLLGILKAGAAYVPIDPGYPSTRKQHIVKDAGIVVLLTQTGYMFDLDFYQGSVVAIDIELETIDSPLILPDILPESLAYVIYTSGSTGTPKGCAITHRNVFNYIQWANDYYFETGITANFGLFTSLSFDLTVTSIFCTLTQGGTLTVYDQDIELQTILIDSFSEDSGINSIKLTPSHISYLNNLNISSTTMHCAIVGGEQINNTQVNILKKINPAIKVYNEYGPTETTVGCIVTELDGDRPVLIGKPIAGTSAYVLTTDNKLCPVGVVGEICIGGTGVGKGYLNNETLSAEKFVVNPFRPEELMYRTGDLGKWLTDSNMVFMGRNDEQIKIRGFRVEPGEIESVLQTYEGLDAAVVLTRSRDDGEMELVAYITGTEGLPVMELRAWLKMQLPAYMIPAHFMQLNTLPLTAHGKIDKRRLPDPGGLALSNYMPARNEMEEQLVVIWQQVLGKDKIGIMDNFFDAGGNSILIVKLSNLVSQLFGKEISVAMLFEYSNIKNLVDHITNEKLGHADEAYDRDELIEELNKFNVEEDEYK